MVYIYRFRVNQQSIAIAKTCKNNKYYRDVNGRGGRQTESNKIFNSLIGNSRALYGDVEKRTEKRSFNKNYGHICRSLINYDRETNAQIEIARHTSGQLHCIANRDDVSCVHRKKIESKQIHSRRPMLVFVVSGSNCLVQ